MNQFWKVEPKLVTIAFGVRALDLAQLALKAKIHDCAGLRGRDLPHVAVILSVEKREKRRERIAVFETQSATVADLERTLDLLVEPAGFPVLSLGGIVG